MTADNLMNNDDVESPVIGRIEEMTEAQCLAMITRATRMKAFYEAQIVKALARFAELRPPGGGGAGLDNDARKLMSAELTVSPRGVDTRVRQSCKLVERLPATLSALEKGEIDQRRALAMVDLAGQLSKEDAGEVERVVLEGGGRANYRRFRESVRQQVIKVDAIAGRDASRRDPDVSVQPRVDGMSTLTVDLTTGEAVAAQKRIEHLAEKAKVPGDTRTDGQRRVAVVVDLVVGNKGGEDPASAVGAETTAPLTPGRDNEQRGEPSADRPIRTELLEEFAVDAMYDLNLIDQVGHVLDIGRRRHPESKGPQRANQCQTPGCVAIAGTSPIAGREESSADTAGVLCAHHKLKNQRSGWTFSHPAPGVLTLTSPDGNTTHTYVIAPDHYLDPPA